MLFAVNVAHSKMICEAFLERGIPAIHCDANTKSDDRDRAVKKLRNDEVKILCNVGIWTTGVDIIEIECIQFANPTRSVIKYLQSLGRGIRPAPLILKENCILIDNAGNYLRFGSPYKEREAFIGKPKPNTKGEIEDISIRTCNQCFYVFAANERQCPDCGFSNPPIIRDIKTKDGELIEYELSDEELEIIQRKNFKKDYYSLKWVGETRVYKKNEKKALEWACNKLREKYGMQYCIDNEHLLQK